MPVANELRSRRAAVLLVFVKDDVNNRPCVAAKSVSLAFRTHARVFAFAHDFSGARMMFLV
jgi:hypothetical protein